MAREDQPVHLHRVPVDLRYGALTPAEAAGTGNARRRRTHLCGLGLVLMALAMVVGFKGQQLASDVFGGPPRVVMSSRPKPTGGWAVQRRARPDERLELTIMLTPKDPKALEKAALAVSDPKHADYGKHWTFEELAERAAPPAAALASLDAWLRTETGRGLENATKSAASDMVSFDVTVAEAEKLLGAEYYMFKKVGSATGKKAPLESLRTMKYSLPPSLAEHIDWVGPTTGFPAVRTVKATRSARASAGAKAAASTAAWGSTVTPRTVDSHVNIPTTEQCKSGATVGVAAFLEQYYNDQDLIKFLVNFGPQDIWGNRPTLRCGGSDCAGKGLETSMDLEYIMTLAKNCNTELWYESGRSPSNSHNEPFLKFFQRALSGGNVPNVFSISYSDWEPGVDEKYARRVDTALQQMAVVGISVVAASGDAGVEGAQPLPHASWPGHVCSSSDSFIPTFPSSSPWVTSVGATSHQGQPTAAGLSGGGFSRIFARPAWQEQAVQAWLARAKADTKLWSSIQGKFNVAGRGYPDVALQGTNVAIVANGANMISGGTSASTPMVAAIITLINDARKQAGKGPVGFINPLLYANPSVMYDVTTGSNPGCGTDGFAAGASWDPVTGLGEPRYSALKAVAV